MEKITVTRNSEWNNRMRQIAIYIDGEKAGTIRNGETKVFEVPSGLHRIRAKVDWCASRELPFTLASEEKKYFRLSGFKYSAFIFPITIAILLVHLILRRTTGFPYFVWLTIPFFLLILYYVTAGRNDYLTLKETESL